MRAYLNEHVYVCKMFDQEEGDVIVIGVSDSAKGADEFIEEFMRADYGFYVGETVDSRPPEDKEQLIKDWKCVGRIFDFETVPFHTVRTKDPELRKKEVSHGSDQAGSAREGEGRCS